MTNYLLLMLQLCLVIVIVFLPAICINLWSRRGVIVDPFSPVIGIVVLALWGVLAWKAHGSFAALVRVCILTFYVVLAGLTLAALARKDVRQNMKAGSKLALVATTLVFIQAVAIGVNPLPVSQEYVGDPSQPGRMVASPPDNGIPFTTAEYFRHGYDGKEFSRQYFVDWGVAARGPLVPFGLVTLLEMSRAKLDAAATTSNWPLAARGQHLASVYGWLLNALVMLGVFQLASVLTRDRQRIVLAVVWAALAPVVLTNTVFTWPKLLATYFLLLAISSMIVRRMALAGGLTALAWLSHPVGALMIPAVGLYALVTAPTSGKKRWIGALAYCLPAAIVGALVMAPWLAFKLWVGNHDPFASYLLGRGSGFDPAHSFAEWLAPRLTNLTYTLVPFKYFFDGQLREWLYGPVNDFSRWLVQYTKTLPGQVGFVACVLAYVSVAAHQRGKWAVAYSFCLLIGALLVMVIFWGFSGDGLGRASLEPVSVLLIVFASVYGTYAVQFAPYVLTALVAENVFISLGQFLADNSFKIGAVPTAAWVCFGIAMLVPLLLLACYIRVDEIPAAAKAAPPDPVVGNGDPRRAPALEKAIA
ncbi:hypothetical protein [Rhodopseudomonas palustris]|uniref:Glycosyltransferase RgtA/B/C/D-like domain-containing protein n=1 Tax=Rhodopseudomonas palustris TaxID=1076 RepID=A0A418VRF1_RHOPL|nr:hypothetical protein [Rhodopseudomonas palustris]RJF78924.1 hypothetical protein D4Q52_01915 [Rhodopseudomonas palustris]